MGRSKPTGDGNHMRVDPSFRKLVEAISKETGQSMTTVTAIISHDYEQNIIKNKEKFKKLGFNDIYRGVLFG